MPGIQSSAPALLRFCESAHHALFDRNDATADEAFQLLLNEYRKGFLLDDRAQDLERMIQSFKLGFTTEFSPKGHLVIPQLSYDEDMQQIVSKVTLMALQTSAACEKCGTINKADQTRRSKKCLSCKASLDEAGLEWLPTQSPRYRTTVARDLQSDEPELYNEAYIRAWLSQRSIMELNRVFIVESMRDVWALHLVGCAAIALGGARARTQQLERLRQLSRQFNVDFIIWANDDPAGRKLTQQLVKELYCDDREHPTHVAAVANAPFDSAYKTWGQAGRIRLQQFTQQNLSWIHPDDQTHEMHIQVRSDLVDLLESEAQQRRISTAELLGGIAGGHISSWARYIELFAPSHQAKADVVERPPSEIDSAGIRAQFSEALGRSANAGNLEYAMRTFMQQEPGLFTAEEQAQMQAMQAKLTAVKQQEDARVTQLANEMDEREERARKRLG